MEKKIKIEVRLPRLEKSWMLWIESGNRDLLTVYKNVAGDILGVNQSKKFLGRYRVFLQIDSEKVKAFEIMASKSNSKVGDELKSLIPKIQKLVESKMQKLTGPRISKKPSKRKWYFLWLK